MPHLTKFIVTTLFLAMLLLPSCGRKTATFSQADRKAVEVAVRAVHGTDSLAALQKRMERKGNRLGSVVALRELGKALRNESRFEEALDAHIESLLQAEALDDTLEWVQALNNIGTDYRRMGVLDAAQDYHYRAAILSDECSDTSFTARKNRVVSLNGIGNIYLTIGNLDLADSVFRLALDGERRLHSTVGQAINYANIGSIFESRRQTDSAWVYYRKSMAMNEEAGNTLGISLCHTYFGSLHERAGEYADAAEEYEAAYSLMRESRDSWHALNSLISLAGLSVATGNTAKAANYLERACRRAERIKSNEHLAEIYTLYYRLHKKEGDYRNALYCLEAADARRDSLMNMEKINRIQNISLNLERGLRARETEKADLMLRQERAKRSAAYFFFGIVVVVLLLMIAMLLYAQRLRVRSQRMLKKMAELRETFFTNITHEFRTPLTMILGLSRRMRDDSGLPEDAREKSGTIERMGNGLLLLVNQLLDISKIRSAIGDPDWRHGDVTARMRIVTMMYHSYAGDRGVGLSFEAREAVVMDYVPDYVDKVLNNLLSNSFKFTPEGGKVDVRVWREDDLLMLDVSDTGVGMDNETAAKVFEPFFQGEGDSASIGTGVGLALVKQIIDSLKGRITVESAVGKGTTFHLSVPIINGHCSVADAGLDNGSETFDNVRVCAPVLPEAAVNLADSDAEDKRTSLLVIEDNPDIAAYIGSHFNSDYAVYYAHNGKEGLDKALTLVPDIIITDLMMPVMDGLEVCRRIRANEVTDHIPVIVVTAKVSEEDRVKGLEAGADAYLTKPFSSEELTAIVDRLLDRNDCIRRRLTGSAQGSGSQGSLGTQVAQDQNVTETPHGLQDEDNEISLADAELGLLDSGRIRQDAEKVFLDKVEQQSRELLEKQDLSAGTLADSLCVSPWQLRRKLLALKGMSPTAYIMDLRMRLAGDLLSTDSTLTIEEISIRCGFTHVTSFHHAFKKAFGMTPSEYRGVPRR